ncbi:MAG: tRNA pseudouridine(55) synthase TruB [Firmicutes bacterium]|nr:tRNA pseudouridine(55) synthase TruB [Bacillota bacterium]
MKGIIVINKPSGISSNAVVTKAKRALGFKKIGHMGTLDPLAEGVLVLGVGKAARLFDFFLENEKAYIATFEFGYETDTLDSEGEVIKKNGNIPTHEELKRVSKKLLGKISQIPPIYSAKSIDGVRAYERARRGEEFEVKPSEVEIYEIDVLVNGDGEIMGDAAFGVMKNTTTINVGACIALPVTVAEDGNKGKQNNVGAGVPDRPNECFRAVNGRSWTPAPTTWQHSRPLDNQLSCRMGQMDGGVGLFKMLIRCSKGTYIRSIGRDLAYLTNSYATMTKLIRTNCSGVSLDDAITIEELEDKKEKAIIPLEIALKNLPCYELCHTYYSDLSHGKKIKSDYPHKKFTLYCKNELFGIATVDNECIKILTYLKD